MSAGNLTLEAIKAWAKRNAPTLLMGGGIACYTGATAYGIYGTIKACKNVTRENTLRMETGQAALDKKGVAQIVWKHYIPCALFFAGGTAAVITANHLQLLRIELLAAAALANKTKLKEYQDKVKEVFGDDAKKKISEQKSREAVFANPPSTAMLPAGPGALLCKDGYTGQYFYSTRQIIDKALTECDRILIRDGKLTLNDLLYRLGCNESDVGNRYGWSTDGYPDSTVGIDSVSDAITLDYVAGPNEEPVLVLQYDVEPFYPF